VEPLLVVPLLVVLLPVVPLPVVELPEPLPVVPLPVVPLPLLVPSVEPLAPLEPELLPVDASDFGAGSAGVTGAVGVVGVGTGLLPLCFPPLWWREALAMLWSALVSSLLARLTARRAA
jgi:hypothetical protein